MGKLPGSWSTRAGIAPAKEKVGKKPERYKLVDERTIFYNPMRIMIGSIAMLDDGGESGITSPDYVVVKPKKGIIHHLWFYHWLRSRFGEAFIKTIARGAVRERMLFKRLGKVEVLIPPWKTQIEVAQKLKAISEASVQIAQQEELLEKVIPSILKTVFTGESE